MKKGMKIFLLCVCMLLAGTEGSAREDVGLTIGIALYSLQNEYTVRFANAAYAYGEQTGVKLEIYDGDYDAALQAAQVEEMVERGLDGVILVPQDAEKCSECVETAVDAGIPVVSVNTRVNSERITSYVGSDDVLAGEMLMEEIAQAIGGSGKVVLLEGPIGQSAQIERYQGVKNVLQKYPDIQIISSKTANWSQLEAVTVVNRWLDIFDHIDAVIAENDDMALGALDALEDQGLQIPVVGIDGSEDALEAVEDGRLLMTVYQDAKSQAEQSIDIFLDMMQGKEIQDAYGISLKKVTKENVEEYR